MPWGSGEYPQYRPRLPANGIRAQSQRGPMVKTWWAGRWIAALERLVDPRRLARGRSYARSGQVVELEVGRDGIDARVQGSRREPYRVGIRFTPLSDAAWERVIDVMAEEAMYAAQLLSGEMPRLIEEVFERAGTSLFPQSRRDLRSECSCPDPANPCKHIAAVHYLLGERFDLDPFLIFLLRGREKDEILEALRIRRAGAAAEINRSAPAGEAERSDVPESAEAFWTMALLPSGIIGALEPPTIDALPVKRFGPPPFWDERADFTTTMEAVYRAISEEAHRLAVGE